MAGAPLGNKNRCVLQDPKVRQKAFESFCAHRAKGKSQRSWWYEDKDGNSCTWETLAKYVNNNPIEFDPVKLKVAESKGFEHWEEVAELSAKGKNKANTASLQMVMRNKFGWDKEEAQVKKSTYIIQVPNDLASGSDVSTSSLSNEDNQGAE